MKITIIGGGAGGLFAALLLARAGHEVMVLEQDRVEPGADVESAADSAHRPTAPQIVQPHVVMARCRELVRDRLPDVYESLLAAGVVEVPISDWMPDTHAILGGPAPPPPPLDSDRISFTQLRVAASFDPTAFRAFWKLMFMLCQPDDVYRDPHIITRTQDVLRSRGMNVLQPRGHLDPGIAQPTRQQILDALATQPTSI
jgi:hypothetical protein